MKRANECINVFDYRFSTKPYNEVLNTYRFAYREYAPDTGRWLSQDPIFERGGHNLYAYCGNDPVNGYDPLGLFIVRPVSDSPRVKTNKFGGLKDLWASFAIFSDDINDDFHGYILHKKYVDIRLLSCKDNTPVLVRKEMLFKRIRIGAFRMGSVYNEFIPEQPKNVYVNLISLYNLPECVHGRIELRATFQHYASSPLVFGEAVNDSLSGSVDYKHNNSAFQSYSGWPKSPKGSKDFSSVAITVKVGCESFDDYAAGRNLDSGYSVNRYERDEDKNGSSGYNWYENE